MIARTDQIKFTMAGGYACLYRENMVRSTPPKRLIVYRILTGSLFYLGWIMEYASIISADPNHPVISNKKLIMP
ncbi:MAG: hypothetical protein KatS3mg035_1084 [Bacteroidia bacterium]|nr:MAG: hypothetical protein KatS3mg035_1084 [Bacteroidia bacterium]